MSYPGRRFELSELVKHIDHTLLKPTATTADIDNLCDEAVKYGFWSVCIPPSYVRHVTEKLKGTGVKVCTVIGFPLGFNTSAVKREEARRALEEGADEIDMVMNIGAFKSEDYSLVAKEIEDIAADCRASNKLLKVIIECCYLTDEEKVKAATLAEKAGAAYIKTSTGLGTGGATVEDVILISKSLAGTAKVKASGGISTLGKAIAMVNAGADRIGTSSGAKIMDELKALSSSTQAFT